MTLKTTLLLFAACTFINTLGFAKGVEYIQPQLPYSTSQVFTIPYATITPGVKTIPLLTWGPDGHIVCSNGGLNANPNSPLAKALGEPVKLAIVDRIDDQVKSIISGQPFFRGTVAQVALVNEGLKKLNPNLELIVIYQVSWSTGADGFVTRGVNTVQDLKGKTIVGQLNGPHMLDMIPKILEDAGLSTNDITIKYVRDINNTADNVTNATDPANALRNDPTIAGAALIGPDIATLTSGEGSGSLRNVKPLFTTKTASRTISDVIAVRKDYFDSHQPQLKALVKVWLDEANLFAEDLENVAKKKQGDQRQLAAFKKKVEPLAAIFLGDKALTSDYILWVGIDAELAKVKGNVEFFQSPNNPVGFTKLLEDTSHHLQRSGFTDGPAQVTSANWDWSNLGSSIFNTKGATTFTNTEAVRAAAAKVGSNNLFKYTFTFPPKESELDWHNHETTFSTIHSNVKRYGGAVIQIRGHVDPLLYNFFRMKLSKGDTTYSRGSQVGIPIPPLESVIQANSKLSYTRAAAIRTAYAAYVREKFGTNLDEADLLRFDIKGMGAIEPIYPNPVTKEQTAANMRGEIVIISVETELPAEFSAEDLK